MHFSKSTELKGRSITVSDLSDACDIDQDESSTSTELSASGK